MSQTRTVDAKQSTIARVAGAALFLGHAIVIPVNFSTSLQYHITDIAAHLAPYRFALACNVFYAADLMVVLSLFYVILEPVNRSVALVATFFRLMSAVGWAVMVVTMLNVLQLLGSATAFGNAMDLSALSTNQVHALANLQRAYGTDAYYVLDLPAWALASLLYSVLWLHSKYIPKVLAIYGVVSSLWAVVCGFANLAVPHFDQMVNVNIYDVPMVIFELVLGLWLLVRGLRISERAV